MLLSVILLSAICTNVQGSGVAHGVLGEIHVAPAPIVAAQSSQYFQRTFNRLIAAAPVIPAAQEPVIPVASVAPPLPVAIKPVIRTVPVNPAPNPPVDPNVAIAIATAHAAAPVATILLPPYPFGFIPAPQTASPDVAKEVTTIATTKAQTQTTTVRELEQTTPLPLASNNNNSFAQPLPTNQNINFKYGPPHQQQPFQSQQQPFQPQQQPFPTQQQPFPPQQQSFQPQQQPFPLQQQQLRPQQHKQPQQQHQLQYPLPLAAKKLRTSVEIVPVPLQYIAPPPIRTQQRPVKLVHSFVPARAKLIIRPVSAPVRLRTVRIPARIVIRRPAPARQIIIQQRSFQQGALSPREAEPTTFNPLFNRPITKPPK